MDKDSFLPDNSRSAQAIYRELLKTGLTAEQLALVGELLSINTVPNVRRTKRMPAVPVPQTWAPNPKHYEWAKAHGRSEQWVLDMADKMRSWAIAKDERRANWDQVLYTFMMRETTEPPKTLFQNGHRSNGLIGGGYA